MLPNASSASINGFATVPAQRGSVLPDRSAPGSALVRFVRSPAFLTLLEALTLYLISHLLDDAWTRLVLVVTAELLLAAVLLQLGWQLLCRDRRRVARASAASLMADDPEPCFMTDAAGAILLCNPAALREGPALTLAEALGPEAADAPALIAQLRADAQRAGRAREEAVARHDPWWISVIQIESDTLLWKVERRGAQRLPWNSVSRSSGSPIRGRCSP